MVFLLFLGELLQEYFKTFPGQPVIVDAPKESPPKLSWPKKDFMNSRHARGGHPDLMSLIVQINPVSDVFS